VNLRPESSNTDEASIPMALGIASSALLDHHNRALVAISKRNIHLSTQTGVALQFAGSISTRENVRLSHRNISFFKA
jgi:hypothetical protein